MVDRFLVDVAPDGRATMAMWPGGMLPQMIGEPVQLTSSLSESDLEDLRWYLEDYLDLPMATWEDRGASIATRLRGWGESLFQELFGAGPARDAYVGARARGSLEIVLRSLAPGWLALPWELMADPDRPEPLVLDGVALSRSLPRPNYDTAVPVGGDRLRVLMVISRPAGNSDVAYRNIARPLLDRLTAVPGKVNFAVLRPPTLDALDEALHADGPFQVVHFDGHGARSDSDGGSLLFEKPDGGPDPVSAERLGRLLARAKVPVVVMNACESGAVGRELEAAVATRLLDDGVAAVVAMAYRVYTVAAAEFVTAFYERLFAGGSVGEATVAGRARMATRPHRPSPVGDLVLEDWLVPVHYMRGEVQFPDLVSASVAARSVLDEALDRLRAAPLPDHDDPLAPAEEFVGRDGVIHDLEIAARTDRVIVLHGPGGTGKTEMAKAFGRWWRDTEGVEQPEWVFWHSFERGPRDLSAVLDGIGSVIFGPAFPAKTAADRRALILDHLRRHRCLLILDNFESVASMPADKPTPEIGEFLRALRTSRAESLVLITSRSPERWLSGVYRITLGGLAPQETVEYATAVLRRFPAAARRRRHRSFAELLSWLDGHPLSIRLTLPHLATTDAAMLLAGLRGTTPFPAGEAGEEDRLDSLPASITYSLRHLSSNVRRLLPAVTLFHGVVNPAILEVFSSRPDTPERFRGVDQRAWQKALDKAADVGLLSRVQGRLFRAHPTLPAYLAAQWRGNDTDRYTREQAAALRAILWTYARFAQRCSVGAQGGDAPRAYNTLRWESTTLTHLLGCALDGGFWDEAKAIGRALSDYWDHRRFDAEADIWADRVRLTVESSDGSPPPLDDPRSPVWFTFVTSFAHRLTSKGQTGAAREILSKVVALTENRQDLAEAVEWLAIACHELGWAAITDHQHAEAERWQLRAIALSEQHGRASGAAASRHQLGLLYHQQGRLADAERLYKEAAAAKTAAEDKPSLIISWLQLTEVLREQGRPAEAADLCLKAALAAAELREEHLQAAALHKLGMIASDLHRWDDAERSFRECLAVRQRIGDLPGMVDTYHELGVAKDSAGDLDAARSWYEHALALKDRLGYRHAQASTHHQLALVALKKGRIDEADECCHRSYVLKQEANDQAGMARSHGVWARVAEARGDLEAALDHCVRCVSGLRTFEHAADIGVEDLLRLSRKLGRAAAEEAWLRITESPIPYDLEECK